MTTQQKKLPSYKNPPISSEVAVGVRFVPLQSYTLPLVGLFWARHRGEFPESQHAIPLLAGLEAPYSDPVTGFPLPRVWLVSKDKRGLLQIQVDALYYNWRKVEDSDSYPRFPSIFDRFMQLLGKFFAFLESEKLPIPQITRCDLTYVNHILEGAGWTSIGDLRTLIPDSPWDTREGRFLPMPRALTWQAQFDLPKEAGRLSVNLSQGQRVIDKKALVRLDLEVTGKPRDPSQGALPEWFDTAHDWIVRGFEDLTSSVVQVQQWGKERGRA